MIPSKQRLLHLQSLIRMVSTLGDIHLVMLPRMMYMDLSLNVDMEIY